MNISLLLYGIGALIALLTIVITTLNIVTYKMLFMPNFARYTVKQDPLGQDWDVMVPYKNLIEKGENWWFQQPVEEVWMNSYDGLKLRADLLRSEIAAKGTIILVAGWHGYPLRDFAPVYRQFHEEGYNLLMIDQRAQWKSEGQFMTFGIKERYDVRDWITFVNGKFGNELPVFLYGISMGCATVMMTVGFELPANVRGVIADCGFTSPYDILSYQIKATYHLPEWPLLNIADHFAKKEAGFGFKEYSALTAMETNVTPMLFVNGDKDDFVPPFMLEKVYNACKAEKERLVVKGAPHSISNCVDNEGYLAVALAFLRRFST